MGYGTYIPVNVDLNRLKQLGFNDIELKNFMYIYNNGGKFSTTALQQYGYSYEQAKRLAYMYNICAGKVSLDSKQDMVKHLRRMFGENYRISMQDLAISNISTVPRVAVISNITQTPYTVWNSNQYKGKNALYKVTDVSGQKVTIETPRKPKLEYRQSKVLPGVLEIKGVRANGNAVVTFDKKYCTLCNRFIIIASLRLPEFHIGRYEMLCFEGTKIYIYASNMGIKENVRYSMGNQRVYDYGIFPADIKPKLDKVAKMLYQHLHGVAIEYMPPTLEYKVVEQHKEIEEDVDIVL